MIMPGAIFCFAATIALSIGVSAGRTVSYRVRGLEAPEHVRYAGADVREECTRTFTSSKINLDTTRPLRKPRRTGRLTFRYSYDAKKRVVGVCGAAEDGSADGMTLITIPRGTEQVCFERIARSADRGKEGEEHRKGPPKYHTRVMADAARIVKNTAWAARQAFLTSLTEAPKVNLRVRRTEPELPAQEAFRLCVVFHNGMFLEPFDQIPVWKETTGFGDPEFWDVGFVFANVLESTGDPTPSPQKPWREKWADEVNDGELPTECFADDHPDGRDPTANIRGGHVVVGDTPQNIEENEEGAYLVPICNWHNQQTEGAHAAMTVRAGGVWAVPLEGYKRSE